MLYFLQRTFVTLFLTLMSPHLFGTPMCMTIHNFTDDPFDMHHMQTGNVLHMQEGQSTRFCTSQANAHSFLFYKSGHYNQGFSLVVLNDHPKLHHCAKSPNTLSSKNYYCSIEQVGEGHTLWIHSF